MADQGSIANLKQNINENIYDNTDYDITGGRMNTVLQNIVDTLDFNGRDFFNVNEYREKSDEYADAAAGRNAVPDEVKKLGLVITYLLSDGWYIDQFVGSNISGWATASNWKAIGPVIVTQNTLTIGGEAKGELAGQLVENPEWAKVVTDNEGKILVGIKKDGTIYVGSSLLVQEIIAKQFKLEGNEFKYLQNPKYAYVLVDSENKIILGITKDGKLDNESIETAFIMAKDNAAYSNIYPKIQGDFTPELSDGEFISLYNEKLIYFATLCKCQVYSFSKINARDTIEQRCFKINHNFRQNVVQPTMSRALFMSQLNKYFEMPIFRFCDAKINNTNTVNFSLRVGANGEQYENGMGEPSTLISDDGQKIELFSSQGYYTETLDGVEWTTPQGYIYHDNTWTDIRGHRSVNKVDGVYMMVAHTYYGDDDYFDLLVSEDKINFYYKGHLFKNGTDIGNGKQTTVLGNTYLFRDKGGIYYLIYEARIPNAGSSWELCLMSCTDIMLAQENDFIGDWIQCPTNPILASFEYPCCNPELVKGCDNQPIKYNGRFYMYYLSYTWEWGSERVATIRRATSSDLIHWEDEGVVFDNRDTPDGGEHNADNGDQCMCEFKGRSYFFYTHNINNYGEGTYPVPMSIRYTIDDRPFIEILKIKA